MTEQKAQCNSETRHATVNTKVRILTYHRIGVPRGGRSYEALTVPPGRFAVQIGLLQRLGYHITGLDEVAAWLGNRRPLRSRPTVLTFDDGFADLYEHAFPRLARAGVPAVVYLVSDLREDVWRRESSPESLRLLDWRRIVEMADAGIVFGSHTRTHPRLTECTPDQLRAEVLDAKKIIEDHLGREVKHFCYPFGAYDERVVDAVREAGYATACTTRRGVVRQGADPLRLPRLTIGKRMGVVRFLLRITVRH